MVSAILFSNGASEDQIRKLSNAIRDNITPEIILVTTEPKINIGKVTVIHSDASTISDAILAAFQKASGTKLLCLDCNIAMNPQIIAQIGAEIQNNADSSFSYFAVRVADELIDYPHSSLDNLVNFISTRSLWPLGCVSLAKSFVSRIDKLNGKNSQTILANLLVRAMSDGEVVQQQETIIEIARSNSVVDSFEVAQTERAELLHGLVESSYIEDLFPDYAWDEFGEECAALCYHNLAAIMFRLGNVFYAEQCLTLGDKFEDSPRSLALKGLIAENQGQTLEGVARLVASLQQYETRKRDDGKHYIVFRPQDIEKINVSLQAGLDALNKRDNENAMLHFRNAVFNFDEFYTAWGLNLDNGAKR